MITAMVTGSIFRVETKESKAGKEYVKATIKNDGAKDGEPGFIDVMSFSATQNSKLILLEQGDVITAVGPLSVRGYTGKDGTIKSAVSIMANNVITMQDGVSRKPTGEKPKQEVKPVAPSSVSEFESEIPF